MKKTYIDEHGESLILDEQFFKEAKRGRPALGEEKKKQVTILLDPDVVAFFKKTGKGWQTRINKALRDVAGLPFK